MIGFCGVVMAGRDPTIPLRKARPCHMIGIAGSSSAMTRARPPKVLLLDLAPSREGSGMSELTPDEVRAAVHPVDDAVVAEIIGTGATHDELVEACHIFAREQKRWTTGEVPPGRVGRVVSILERIGLEVKESWLGEYGTRFQ
jgi:hypothetical protein